MSINCFWHFSLVLYRNYENDYYILSGEDDDTKMDTLYSGSVYFSKDCFVEALESTEHSEREHTVNARDYLTKNNQEGGAHLFHVHYPHISSQRIVPIMSLAAEHLRHCSGPGDADHTAFCQ